MLSKTAKGLLSRFLVSTEQGVLDTFASLQGAIVTKEYVYVPGTRDDRILLVAHADTVNHRSFGNVATVTAEEPPRLMWMGDVVGLRRVWHEDKENKRVWTGNDWIGPNHSALGADDRAGCAMLWYYKDSGHSLLITTGEESGLNGARAAVRNLKGELADHCFALEVDRRGDRQAVFYDVSTKEFREYVLSLLSASDPENEEWLEYNGSSTDIKYICDEVRICGVNVSAGYLGEHGVSEMLFLEAWLHTKDTLKKFLAAEHRDFLLPIKKIVVTQAGIPDRLQWRWCGEHTCYMDKCQNLHPEHTTSTPLNSHVGKQYQTRIFRMNGEKAGEGTVALRYFSPGDSGPLSCGPTSLSKRQAKKLAKAISHMLGIGKLNNDEATRLLAEVILLRDVEPQGVRCAHGYAVSGKHCAVCKGTAAITEEQRADAAAGIHPQEKPLIEAPDQYGEAQLGGDAAVAIAIAAAKCGGPLVVVHQEISPGSSNMLTELAAAEQLKDAYGVFDRTSGHCWHNCVSCRKRWYHVRTDKDFCRLRYQCLCPQDGSPTVYQMIGGAEWGFIADIRKHLTAATGAKVTERVSCGHYCHLCKAAWKHIKPSSGKCDVGVYDVNCPYHSRKTFKAVETYENICKLPGWATSLHRASEDPNDAASNEPAQWDVSQFPLLTDGKTGSGLKVDSQREGEL